MMKNAFRFLIILFISISSTSLLPAIYLIKSSYSVISISGYFSQYEFYINIAIYLLLTIILAYISLLFIKCQALDSITNDVQEISPVNNEYLPIYLGYIFVSLSIPTPSPGEIDLPSLIIIYILICLFVSLSKSLCFNPIFIIFGYSYYIVKTQRNIKVFVISKKEIQKNDSHITFPHLTKINETVYFDKDL